MLPVGTSPPSPTCDSSSAGCEGVSSATASPEVGSSDSSFTSWVSVTST